MNINALPGMGPNGLGATILLYTADDDHKNARFTPIGLYETGELALRVARRMMDPLKDIATANGVLTDQDFDIARRDAERAVMYPAVTLLLPPEDEQVEPGYCEACGRLSSDAESGVFMKNFGEGFDPNDGDR